MNSSRHSSSSSLALLVAMAVLSAACSQGPKHFDQAKWGANQVGSAASVRSDMLPDLLGRLKLRSLSKDQVQALLGPPMSYNDTPTGEDWYVIEERYRNESDRFEKPYLQRHLVIKYLPGGTHIREIGVDRSEGGSAATPINSYEVLVSSSEKE
jgi:hypothetical protein